MMTLGSEPPTPSQLIDALGIEDPEENARLLEAFDSVCRERDLVSLFKAGEYLGICLGEHGEIVREGAIRKLEKLIHSVEGEVATRKDSPMCTGTSGPALLEILYAMNDRAGVALYGNPRDDDPIVDEFL